MEERFDKEGRLIFPEKGAFPAKAKVIVRDKNILVTQAYCRNGHNLVRGEKIWDGNRGINLIGKIGERKVNINLSPYQGDNRRVLDGIIEKGEIVTLLCPECGTELEIFSPCGCSADIVYMYLTEELDPRDSICVCSRFGCRYSCLTSRGKIVSEFTV
ncbi:hypothetical protein CH333_09425 [candidate division WOR-3 bacterium JGI_Cruoil_03_44_89]|uniref:Uncharacterized protein n=1 Tax=candidate division WOR-3 bacterium JGI_Cruoil_03_44_89 TaxID=1973748 RepID=A0A235BPT7_UNCW3|nr:MAG: hypothetical protein CH333_09425 [candidate division WOR-3 bacterium JGI_Cruoil_03_44_89]